MKYVILMQVQIEAADEVDAAEKAWGLEGDHPIQVLEVREGTI